jgi:hypothetical protein
MRAVIAIALLLGSVAIYADQQAAGLPKIFTVNTSGDGGGNDPPDPPTGAPTIRTTHPRLLIIDADDTGFGVQIDTLRTRLQTSDYSTTFDDYIDAVNATTQAATGKTKIAACYDGYAFAFLALVDPVNHGFSNGLSSATYAAAAKAHALYIADQMQSDTWEEKNDSEYLLAENSVNMSISLIYDWTSAAGTVWSDAEKRELIEGALENFDTPGTVGSNNAFIFGSQFTTHYLPLLGLAMKGDAPSGSTLAYDHDQTLTYTEAVDLLYAEAVDLWLDDDENSYYSGVEANLDAVAVDSDGNQKAGHFEGNSYMQGFATHITLGALLMSSAHENLDLFDRNDYLSSWPVWGFHSIRPIGHGWTSTDFATVIRFGVAGLTVDYNGGQARYGVWYGAASGNAFMTTPDTTLVRAIRWARDNWNLDWSNGNDADDTRKAYQTFYRYIMGIEHVGAAMTPAAAAIPTSYEFAAGHFSFRTGFDSVDDTLVTFKAPEHQVVGGHWSNNLSAFRIEKYGNLVLQGGLTKSGGPAHVGWQNQSFLDLAVMGVYDASENSTVNDRENGIYGGHWWDETNPGPSGSGLCAQKLYRQGDGLSKDPATGPATALQDRYYCNAATVNAKALASNAAALTGYDYVNYTYSGAWKTSKVSFANRTFVYQRGAEDHEYVITVDYLTSVDDDFPKFYNLKVPDNVTLANGSEFGTVVETGADFHRRQGGIWRTANTNALKMSNTFTINGYTQRGVLHIQSLAPAGTWTKVGGDYYEFRDATGDYAPYTNPDPTWTEIASTSSCGTTCTLITIRDYEDTPDQQDDISNHKIPSTGGPHYVLISGHSAGSLNGQHVATKVGNLTFSVPVAYSAGTGGSAYRSFVADTGGDWAGAYRLEMRPTAAATNDLFLTVLQFGNNNTLTTMSATVKIDGDGGDDIVGVQINDSTQKQLHVFSARTDAGLPTCSNAAGTCSITPTISGSIRVRVYGVAASTQFYYSAGSTILFDTADGGSWTPVTSSAAGVIEFTYTR